MSEIALYNLLKRIPDVSNDEAKEAVVDVASCKQSLIYFDGCVVIIM